MAGLNLGPRAWGDVKAQSAATLSQLLQDVTAQVPALSASRNPLLLPELQRHLGLLLDGVPAALQSHEPADLAFARAYGTQLAAQRFPLEAALHIHRCAQKAISKWLCTAVLNSRHHAPPEASVALVDFAAEYVSAASAELTAEYVSETRALADAEGGRRTELLNILLSGYDESDGRVALLLKREGYLEQRRSYCVVVVQPVIAAEMASAERAQRIINGLSALVAQTPFRLLAGVHNGVVAAIFSAQRRQSGWTAPQTGLAERLDPLLQSMGPAVLVGVSTDQPSTASIAKAAREALVALEYASFERRVVQFAALPLRSLVLHKGGELLRSVLPHWARALAEADQAAHGAFSQTLRAMAAGDLNVQAAGRALGLHANTVYARLERVETITGLDARRYADLSELLLALDCVAS